MALSACCPLQLLLLLLALPLAAGPTALRLLLQQLLLLLLLLLALLLLLPRGWAAVALAPLPSSLPSGRQCMLRLSTLHLRLCLHLWCLRLRQRPSLPPLPPPPPLQQQELQEEAGAQAPLCCLLPLPLWTAPWRLWRQCCSSRGSAVQALEEAGGPEALQAALQAAAPLCCLQP